MKHICFADSSMSLLPNEDDYKGPPKTTKKAANSHQAILDSFPLLDFMQSPVLSARPKLL